MEEAVAPVEAPAVEVSEDAALAAVWQKAQDPVDVPEEQPEEPPKETPAEEPVEAVEEDGLPDNIPDGLKSALRGMPEDARKAVLTDRDGLHRKLSDMGRQVHGIAPIRDVLVEAIKHMPALADMKPQQVAQEVFELAKVSQGFREKPVETMVGLIRKHGLEGAVQKALGGQPQQQGVDPWQKIAALEQHIQKISDPSYLRDQVTSITSQEKLLDSVNDFAAKAAHWDDVNEHIPLFLEAARAKVGFEAAPRAVLEAAYDMALSVFKPETQAPKQPVDDPKLATDPEKTQAAIKAKSVNVQGKATGRARVLTEDEELAAVYQRARQA